MASNLYTDLGWLPRAPADFAQRAAALKSAPAPIGRALRALTAAALDENQLTRVARVIRERRREAGALAPLTPFRLAILSNSTTDFLIAPLVATAARHGIDLEVASAPYGQAMQAALDAGSSLYRDRPDAVLVAIDYRGLPLAVPAGDAAAAEAGLAAALAEIAAMRSAIHQHAGIPCVVQTLARPVESLFGGLDLCIAGTERAMIDAFNRALAASMAGTPDLLVDVAALAENVGLADWHDPGLWNLGKIPFANQFLPVYADHVCRLIAALRGRSRRCLILDLDNTLWGGVIGDDGLEGIVLAQGDATGEAHLTVQRTALALRARGIVLAVSSKNQDETARLPFQKHPEMLLRESHIAVFQANWKDKATNIKAIAEELSLGLESMVFLDDNPAERGLVREILPEVAIPELPADPALFARTLIASGYFEAIAYSAEDRQRADFYQDNARRLALQRDAGDVNAYLRSLSMTIQFASFDAIRRARISQLINKSNQFNLTTRRYTEADVAALEGDSSALTLQVRLRDTFGDNGMISVIICRPEGQDWRIDTWLMSCRVLGRGVERAVLNEMVREARERGVKRLHGSYIPTERNQLVEHHYQQLGFEAAGTGDGGTTHWTLVVANYAETPVEMEIERAAAGAATA